MKFSGNIVQRFIWRFPQLSNVCYYRTKIELSQHKGHYVHDKSPWEFLVTTACWPLHDLLVHRFPTWILPIAVTIYIEAAASDADSSDADAAVENSSMLLVCRSTDVQFLLYGPFSFRVQPIRKSTFLLRWCCRSRSNIYRSIFWDAVFCDCFDKS